MQDIRKIKINYIISVRDNNSTASVNRIKSFKKGIELSGGSCNIHFTETRGDNIVVNKFKSLSKLILLLLNASKDDIFIFYGKSFYYFLILLFKWKIKFYVERNEYPYFLINENYNNINERIKERILNNLLKYTDGFITCSIALKEYYIKFCKHDNIFISPLIVDVNKFEKAIDKVIYNCEYVAYVGSLGNNKDGVPILINSFSLLKDDFPDLKLVIIGNTNVKEFDVIFRLVKGLELEKRVIFTGIVDHDLVPSILKHASLLALARPNNKQAEGGIPSKVGEYMASRVPMVLTDVGELNYFLKDGFNCYMAQPDSINDFTSKMKSALTSKNNDIIVLNAFDTVLKFNVLNQAKKLIDFLT